MSDFDQNYNHDVAVRIFASEEVPITRGDYESSYFYFSTNEIVDPESGASSIETWDSTSNDYSETTPMDDLTTLFD